MFRSMWQLGLTAVASAFLALPAIADKGVFSSQLSVDELFVGEPTLITVSAEVGAEDLYINSVSLYETTAEGQPLQRLGSLNDDGINGDARPADTIFSMQFEVSENVATTRYFRVSAAYRGDRGRYLSPVLPVTVYEPIATSVFEDMLADLAALESAFHNYLLSMSLTEARLAVLGDAQANPNILTAELIDDDLSLLYAPGISGWVPLTDPDEILDAPGNSVPTSLPADYKSPGNDKLLIFAPGYSDASPQDKIADHAKSQFDNAEFMEFDPNPVTITKDSAASLAVVKTWGNYGTVIMHTHGGYLNDSAGNKKVVLLTGTHSNLINYIANLLDIVAGRIGVSSGKFYIYPSYITKHAASMQNTFFYLGACESMKDDSMWNALKAKGAKVGFGWSETVFRTFNTDKFKDLINPMLPTNNTQDPITAKASFDAIANKCDAHATPACLTMRTASADWQKFVFAEGGLINGDFETGDWTGWTHGGDYNFRIVSGARKQNGSYSGALGRWDTAYHGFDPTSEPYGYEWFYQDFVVPNAVTKLKFAWWMETYDTAVWDWFDAYLKDTSGNTLVTILEKAGKPGTNYGPYWTTSGWQQVEVDLTPYQGQEIRIYFDQRLDGYGDQQRVYVDDVVLE